MQTLNTGEFPDNNSLGVFSFTTVAWLVLTSLLFALVFEWERYQIISIHRLHGLSLSDKAVLLWLLMAKSMIWFIPLLPIGAALVGFGLRRTAFLLLTCCWIVVFFLMALDLVSVWFSSYHAWDYFPSLDSIVQHPSREIHHWLQDRLCNDPLVVFSFFVLFGPISFLMVNWTVLRLRRPLSPVLSDRSSVAFLAVFIVLVLGAAPILALFDDKVFLDRTLNSISSPQLLRESLRRWIHQPESQVGHAHAESLESRSPITNSGEPMENNELADIAVRSGKIFDAKDGLLASKYVDEAANPGPSDPDAFVRRPNLPNVILIVLESLRPSAVSPSLMKDLDSWSMQGLRLQRHYSGSNCSHLGLFSLFYGRCPIGYDQTLERKIPAQFFQSLRKSGYTITFVTAGETVGFRRLDEFINGTQCDEICVVGEFNWEKKQDWPNQDSGKLAKLKSILHERRDRPQFVFCYLVSSMYRYAFPEEHNIFKESWNIWQFLNVSAQFQSHFSRYANSVLFLEHELMGVLRSLDMKNNVVIVTSDHGESFGEDGVFKHATRLSDVQLRVPCIIAGGGIEPATINSATVHYDILPTLLHALNGTSIPICYSQGRDLIEHPPQPNDEIVLGPADVNRWEGVLIVRDEKRMAFTAQMSSKEPAPTFTSLVDVEGQFQTK